MKLITTYFILTICLSANCFSQEIYELPTKEQFNQYWYKQGAEITSYELSQHRYTEIRKGYVVNIFVTEPFDKIKQVKSDNPSGNKNATQVLKLNQIKKFNTGIYQYSIMNSAFTPIESSDLTPLKTSASIQEWCGHVYLQLNQKEKGYDLSGYSYFESEGDVKMKLPAAIVEDGLWNTIRLNPNKLPVGDKMMIPSVNYLKLMHKDLKDYKANLKLEKGTAQSVYSIDIKELKRKITITFENKFPFKIVEWKESYPGLNHVNGGKMITTTVKIRKTIHSFYWEKNKNKDIVLRGKLGLDSLLKE